MGASRCPMCHAANDARAWHCESCGYEFGQSIDTLRGMLHAQLRRSRIAFWILLAIDLSIIAGIVYAARRGIAVTGGLLFVMLIWWTVRARQKIAISRHSLMLIDKQQAPLPEAKLKSG